MFVSENNEQTPNLSSNHLVGGPLGGDGILARAVLTSSLSVTSQRSSATGREADVYAWL